MHINSRSIALKVQFLNVHCILAQVTDFTSVFYEIRFRPMQVTQFIKLVGILSNPTFALHEALGSLVLGTSPYVLILGCAPGILVLFYLSGILIDIASIASV